jgi:hypothetical protein
MGDDGVDDEEAEEEDDEEDEELAGCDVVDCKVVRAPSMFSEERLALFVVVVGV